MRTNTNNIYRDKIMSDITEQDVGSNLKIAGWVENIRDHGGVSFIDLRDMYGVMQVVMRDTSLLDGINKEDCISVEGAIEHRDEETYNPKIPTGTIELEAHHVDILGKVYRQLPFEIATSKETREDVRLKYRYLDLRNIKVRDNMIFRSKVISYLREKMTEMGFLEIQTPILCASSPEGARDYIVPSRKFKGKFYALPQAPQQYKQLLMVSGFDKYFQIAPCFRDEDARADRSPGEFYQLDFEMSFATQEDVFRVGEEVLSATFEKFAPEGAEVTQAPYPIISYKQAMLEFGTDKPDLRIDLVLTDATEVMQGCGFAAFEGQTVKAIVVDGFTATRKQIDAICAEVEVQTARKGFWFRVDENGEFVGGISKFLQDRKEEVIKALGLKNGDFVGLAAGKKLEAQKTAGVYRKLLGAASEKHMKKDCYEFCWIVDFPMYEIGEESGELEFCHNPFSMPQGGMDALNNQDPLEILAYQYDLVCNGVELSSGAVRNHDPEIMIKAFELVGLGEADVKAKFPAMYNAFCYGAPPHAGIAPGVDRMIMLICGEESIREIIPFPMNKNAIATIGILAFISQWNSFVWPLMVTKSDAHRVMPIGLLHFRDAVSSQVNLQMAGATIVIVPMLIFFLVFRKQIIAGVARGGIKG